MAGRMYLGSQMVTPAIASVVESVNGKTGDVILNYSDVGALPASTKYAKTLSFSINNQTYVLTSQLYDQDGNALGNPQTVDLPLESVVVNGSYDNTNKKIILTLNNGNTIDVPVGDLVSGLQTEITTTNKLSSDLVSDTNNTNKFVTENDITNWNGKQDALPSQTGNNGKFLTTNGSTMSWVVVDALPNQSGQSGKYLTTDGTSASWASVNALVITDYTGD